MKQDLELYIKVLVDCKSPPILIWIFEKAPEFLKNFSTDKKNATWVALLPNRIRYMGIPWLQKKTMWAYRVERYLLTTGFMLYIGHQKCSTISSK